VGLESNFLDLKLSEIKNLIHPSACAELDTALTILLWMQSENKKLTKFLRKRFEKSAEFALKLTL
jgi:hypothetical protein